MPISELINRIKNTSPATVNGHAAAPEKYVPVAGLRDFDTQAVPDFPLEVLPVKLREIIRNCNRYLSYPVDFTAASILSASGIALGRTHRIKYIWTSSCTMYLALVAPPGAMKSVRYWDKAGTAGAGCFTAGVKVGRDGDGRFWILDVVRGQWGAPERERMIRQTAQADGVPVPVWIEQEPGSGGKESAESTVRNLAGFVCYADRVTGAKETRAEPFAAQVASGNVWLARGAWNRAFIDECAMFPVGKFKDQVDAASGAFVKLTQTDSPVGVSLKRSY